MGNVRASLVVSMAAAAVLALASEVGAQVVVAPQVATVNGISGQPFTIPFADTAVTTVAAGEYMVITQVCIQTGATSGTLLVPFVDSLPLPPGCQSFVPGLVFGPGGQFRCQMTGGSFCSVNGLIVKGGP